jgi:hypothetical protein
MESLSLCSGSHGRPWVPANMPMRASGEMLDGVLYLFEPDEDRRDAIIVANEGRFLDAVEATADSALLPRGALLLGDDRAQLMRQLTRWDSFGWCPVYQEDPARIEDRRLDREASIALGTWQADDEVQYQASIEHPGWWALRPLPEGWGDESLLQISAWVNLTDPSLEPGWAKQQFFEAILEEWMGEFGEMPEGTNFYAIPDQAAAILIEWSEAARAAGRMAAELCVELPEMSAPGAVRGWIERNKQAYALKRIPQLFGIRPPGRLQPHEMQQWLGWWTSLLSLAESMPQAELRRILQRTDWFEELISAMWIPMPPVVMRHLYWCRVPQAQA